MLSAVLGDSARVPGVSVVTLLAEDHPGLGHPCRRVAPPDEEAAFRTLAARADGTLVIAPETGGLLHQRCHWAEEAGGRLLGPGSEGVALAADKLALAGHLAACGVPAPPTLGLGDALGSPAVT